MIDIVVLGPQTHRPTFPAVLQELGVTAGVCAITAGWQENEGDIEELAPYSSKITDLMLYQRAEYAFESDPELFQAHRGRQAKLQELQNLYRLRLDHASAALEKMLDAVGDEELLRAQRRSALAALRALDRQHLLSIASLHRGFQERWRPLDRPSVAHQRRQLAEHIAASHAVLLAGGHVANLIARLRLFDLAPLLSEKPLIAWSAGAMALTERIVLFHDRSPQGASNPEVLDAGLGLLNGVVALPHARQRLLLSDRQRVGAFARRFAPARCIMLNQGTQLRWRQPCGELILARQARRLSRSGRLLRLEV